ncbi:hypothetical protein FPHYL_11319 [Fusarium phyllophilum]|uniref:Uncharacterized protein n=1 Tax=Fusarium phyllophilum TaxID=47803 RepID=A0A8H5MVZ8_9HYPO|nr:hypothetical protein FPHYL_11319 [Fusarium phyllophilum]
MAVYYETSWSILSTIGLVNFFFAWIVIGITRLSWLSAIPAIVSAAGAVANGLCYYAWYMNSGKPKTATAYAVADILWMIQEGGLSFYSYIILKQVLQNKARRIFMILIKSIFTGEEGFTNVVNGAHVGYFFSLASVECLSAFFLLQVFVKAKKTSEQLPLSIDLLASKLTFTHGSQNESYRLTQRRTVGRERLPSVDNTSLSRVVDLEHQNNAQSKEITRFTTRSWMPSSSTEPRHINTDSGSNTSQVGIVRTITTTVTTSA